MGSPAVPRPRNDRRRAGVLLLLGVVAALAAIPGRATASESEWPTVYGPFDGNPTCGELAGDYAGGQTWTEVKIEDSSVGEHTSGPITMTVNADNTIDFTSTVGVDAVFVKAGNDKHLLYVYDPPGPEAFADTGLAPAPGQGNGISHVSFCFDGDPTPSTTTTTESTTTTTESTTTTTEPTTTTESTTTTTEPTTTTTEPTTTTTESTTTTTEPTTTTSISPSSTIATTTTESTTTTISPSSTMATTTTVLGPTTTSQPPTDGAAEVRGVRLEQSAATAPTTTTLPTTGGESRTIGLLAIALLSLGGALVYAGRAGSEPRG